MNVKKFWGYKDKDGKYHAMTFTCFNRIHDAYTSGEAVAATGPFPAQNMSTAKKIVKQKLK